MHVKKWMMYKKMDKTASISVVIPVYNSEDNLNELTTRLGEVLKDEAAKYELILVDDGSHDGSWKRIRQLAKKNIWIRGIRLMRNYGQHNALLCGLRQASHEITITMDDDLQNPPEEIPKLLEKLSEGYDVVYGTPEKEQHNFTRNLASRVTKNVLKNIMGAETASKTSAFRAFRTIIRDAFTSYMGSFVSIDVLLTWGTTRFTWIPVHHVPRARGVSNYTFYKLIVHALNMMTGFNTFPLQLASLIGFAFTFFGILVFTYVISSFLLVGGSIQGFPFLASIIAIFSGAQLFALGIIGEYMARMFFRIMGQPPFVIRSHSDHD
jgi:undecaprenyl-phosphate 4-deoxy-4-formamido-L-arabinose transferase